MTLVYPLLLLFSGMSASSHLPKVTVSSRAMFTGIDDSDRNVSYPEVFLDPRKLVSATATIFNGFSLSFSPWVATQNMEDIIYDLTTPKRRGKSNYFLDVCLSGSDCPCEAKSQPSKDTHRQELQSQFGMDY
ncbi:MAG: hypothetical protein J3Q66DRAFT_375102 [Benniella sp.]|nr:MAG: hypothetical protein J3Q66DRAFT_375102 [Benniella sp.]